MKDTIITARRKKREILIVLSCFLAANLVNIYAIIRYGTRWSEVFTQLGYVVCITAVLYLAVLLVRLPLRLFRRKNHG